MKITFSSKIRKNLFTVLPVFEKDKNTIGTYRKLLKDLALKKAFVGKDGESFYVYSQNLFLVGLGKPNKSKIETVLSAFGTASKAAGTHRAKTIAVVLPQSLEAQAQTISTALVLGSYKPSAQYKTGKAQKKIQESQLAHVEFIGKKIGKIAREEIQKGVAMGNAVNEVRDWVNAPPNYASTAFFDEKAKEISKAIGAKLTVLKNPDMEKLGMGGILAVNRGCPDGARLMILDYTPKGADTGKKPVVFVGKGIIFDSGGYNLKPHGHIEDMQSDKAGASAVLGLFRILPLLKLNRRIIGVAPLTENLIGSRTLKPSEIIKTYSGKTVEITNTDAEGRLILCDAVAYAIEQYKPEFIIDIATLTGACVIALGNRYAGLFGNNSGLMKSLRVAGKETNELLWPLPIHKDFVAKGKGYYADLRNADIGSERYAGASKGAVFIREFVGKTPWAHLDIAGTAFTQDPQKYDSKGATGFGVRLFARFIENLC